MLHPHHHSLHWIPWSLKDQLSNSEMLTRIIKNDPSTIEDSLENAHGFAHGSLQI